MKKLFFFLVFLLVAAFAFAQDTESTDFAQSPVTSGTILTEHDVAGLQQTSDALNINSNSNRKLTIAGWVLFGAGIPVTAYGGYLVASGLQNIHNDEPNVDDSAGKEIGGAMLFGMGVVFTAIGAGAVVSGIVCLGVAYSRKNANLTESGIRERKPLMTYNLQSSRDGLGFAIRF